MFRTITALAALTIAACNQTASDTPDLTPETPPPAVETAEAAAFSHNDYTDMATWLCHPDKADDACAIDLTTTAINPDNSTEIIPFEAATNPGFDCFYYYPTVSNDETDNSDMIANDEEINVIANQFARYGASCRLFAPLYRQRTLTALRRAMATGEDLGDPELRYADILDSWTTYMRDHNDGRGVILIGHSQGAGMVYELLQRDIIGTDAEKQIIAVHSIGTTRHIDTATGTWRGLPPCTASDDTGCLVTYVSFRETSPPPADTGFGISDGANHAICVNPASLIGDGALAAYLPNASGFDSSEESNFGIEITTPFVTLPGLLSASCERSDKHNWLAITIHAEAGDARIDDIGGDVRIGGVILKDWGLHIVDMNLAMGNLVSLAETQGATWITAHESE